MTALQSWLVVIVTISHPVVIQWSVIGQSGAVLIRHLLAVMSVMDVLHLAVYRLQHQKN